MNALRLVHSYFDRLTGWLHLLAGVILLSMMMVTLADIASRYIFDLSEGDVDLTFIGGVELIKYGLMSVILLALPHSLTHAQVVVDLFTDNMHQKHKFLLGGLYTLGYMLLAGGMSYRFYEASEMSVIMEDTTQDLMISMYYFYDFAAAATAILAVAALIAALRLFLLPVEELEK